MFKFKTTSESQTEKFGECLARALTDESVIALDGDLGAGKTCLARGIARGLGVTSFVSSPTFTIVNEYEGGRLKMFHFDTYRLADEEDFINAGLDEYFGAGVCVIEWSDVISGVLPADAIRMRITGSGDERVFEVDDAGTAKSGAAGDAGPKSATAGSGAGRQAEGAADTDAVKKAAQEAGCEVL